jgi:hypothetical protein
MWQRLKAERRVGVAPPGESRMLEQPGKTKNIEELDDGLEVQSVIPFVHCGTLCAAVGEKLWSYSDPSLVLALRASLKSVQNGSCRFSR